MTAMSALARGRAIVDEEANVGEDTVVGGSDEITSQREVPRLLLRLGDLAAS